MSLGSPNLCDWRSGLAEPPIFPDVGCTGKKRRNTRRGSARAGAEMAATPQRLVRSCVLEERGRLRAEVVEVFLPLCREDGLAPAAEEENN